MTTYFVAICEWKSDYQWKRRCSSSYVAHNTAVAYLSENTRTLFSAHLFQQKVGDFAAVRLTSARKLDLEILALQGRQNTSVGNSDRYNKVSEGWTGNQWDLRIMGKNIGMAIFFSIIRRFSLLRGMCT